MLEVKVVKLSNNTLDFVHPQGKNAIELGPQGIIKVDLGDGFTTPEMQWLDIEYNGDRRRLDLSNKDNKTITFGDNGPSLFVYSNARSEFFIRDERATPESVGEWDVEFYVGIKDTVGENAQTYELDPEIKLKSGSLSRSAAWAVHTAVR